MLLWLDKYKDNMPHDTIVRERGFYLLQAGLSAAKLVRVVVFAKNATDSAAKFCAHTSAKAK